MKDSMSLLLRKATFEERFAKRALIKSHIKNSVVRIYADRLYRKVHSSNHVEVVEAALKRSLLDCVLILSMHQKRHQGWFSKMRKTRPELADKLADKTLVCLCTHVD